MYCPLLSKGMAGKGRLAGHVGSPHKHLMFAGLQVRIQDFLEATGSSWLDMEDDGLRFEVAMSLTRHRCLPFAGLVG